MTKLTTIEGIAEATSEKLGQAGVDSVESLLKSGATKDGRATLAGKSGISEVRILKLVNHADLMRIKGIGGEYSELLEACGVDSVPELAQRNAANLLEKAQAVNAEKKLVRALPAQTTVQGWIDQAKQLPKAVQH